jgi:hypothetical protein
MLYGMTEIKNGIGDPANPVVPNTMLNGLALMRTGLTHIPTPINLNPGMKEGLDEIAAKLPALVTAFDPVLDESGLYGAPANVYTALLWCADPTKVLPLYDHQGTVEAIINGAMGAKGLLEQLCTGKDVNNPSVYLGTLQLQAGIGDPATENTLRWGVAQLIGGVDQMKAGFGDATKPGTLLYGVNAVIGGLNQVKAGIGDAATANTLLWGVGQLIGGVDQMTAAFGSPTTPNTVLYGTNAITGGLTQMQGGLGSATTPDTLLYGANAVYGGLSQIKGGVSTGSMANPGMYEGLQLLDAGLQEAVAGIGSTGTSNTLLWGADQINNGLEELKAGITRAVTEGTDVMQAGIGESLKTLDLTVGQLASITKRGEKFDTFMGRVKNKGSTSDVRFLLQTSPVQNPNQNNGMLIALVLSLVGAAVLVVLSMFAYKRYA